jgi:hypothetical protein
MGDGEDFGIDGGASRDGGEQDCHMNATFILHAAISMPSKPLWNFDGLVAPMLRRATLYPPKSLIRNWNWNWN